MKSTYNISAISTVLFSIIFFPFARSYEPVTFNILMAITAMSFVVLLVTGTAHYFLSGEAKRKQEEAIAKWKSVSSDQFIKTQFLSAFPIMLVFAVALIFTESENRLSGIIIASMMIVASILPDIIAWIRSRFVK